MTNYSVVSMFTGAGGLDLGFEREGFRHLEAVEWAPWAVETLRKNRPEWNPVQADVHDWDPSPSACDVLIGGPPCQGFSLGGNRVAADDRNGLFRQTIRVAAQLRPRAVVIENVLNLRTMTDPDTGRPFALQIAHELENLGYDVLFDVFKVAHYGVPQTRRRFVFVGFLGGRPPSYQLPAPGPVTPIRPFVYDLAQGGGADLPNHAPAWGFKSAVHVETGGDFDPATEVVPVRFSRTASDGNPIRSFDEPFPAIDTATVWGWAQGNVRAARHEKDRSTGKHIRNPTATVTLWRVAASRLRSLTHREYARLQTFPDDWVFLGNNKRDIHLQIGNAVPVEFARQVARSVRLALEAKDAARPFEHDSSQLRLY
jgi:DNA (cytosine-5)-methyltransferase 1